MNKGVLRLIVALVLAVSCNVAAAQRVSADVRDDFTKHFKRVLLEGSFSLYNLEGIFL